MLSWEVFQCALYGAGAVTVWTLAVLEHKELKVLEAEANRLWERPNLQQQENMRPEETTNRPKGF